MVLDGFSPMDAIPTAVRLTTYAGRADNFMHTPLDDLAQQITAGKLHLPTGPTFRLHQIAKAKHCMEQNCAGGKIVILT